MYLQITKLFLLKYHHTSQIFFLHQLVLTGIICCLSGLTQVKAQPDKFIFRHLTTENGLISNSVSCILQDSQGFIWIGLQTGLQRYDGHRFRTYQAEIHNPDALQNDWVTTIFEDTKKRLWIGTNGSAYLFDHSTGKFYNYNLHANSRSNIILGIWKFSEDGNGDIWVCGHDHYFKLNKSTNQFEIADKLLAIEANSLPSNIGKDNDGNIWITTTTGVKYFDIKENILYDKKNNPQKLPVFNIKATPLSIFFEPNGDALITTQGPNQLLRFNRPTRSLSSFSFRKPLRSRSQQSDSTELIDDININHDGKIIITLIPRGVALYDPSKKIYSILSVNNEDPNGLHFNPESYPQITTITDREGNIWIASNKGLNIFNPELQRFHAYSSSDKSLHLPAYSVSSFLQTVEDGDIYIGYYYFDQGIIRLDSNLKFKRQYLLKENGNINTIKNQVWCLFRDEKNNIWAPNQANDILKIDPLTNTVRNVHDSLIQGPINIIKRDNNKVIWMGHWRKGLVKMEKSSHAPTFFTQGPKGTTIRNVLCLYIDSNIIWGGTIDQGLFAFDKSTEHFTALYQFDQNNRSSISSNNIVSIIPYNTDTLILATGLGINIFDKRKKIFSSISSKDGLPNNLVVTLALDKNDNLWAGFIGGFSKINMKTKAITNYGLDDGIVDDMFNNAAFLKLRNGNFLVPGLKGFLVFNPDSVAEARPPPNVVITGFSVYNRKMTIDSLINTDQYVTLKHTQNNVRIEFTSLEYSFPGKTRYYYRLEGVDKDWILAEEEQAAIYHQLGNGKFTFYVKCVNREGIECTHVTRLRIFIIPPIWNRWWFYLLMAFLIGGGFIFLLTWNYKRRSEKDQLRRKYERKIAEVEMNTLRAQMNPHFIFNSLNSINDFILSNDPDNASGYLTKFSRLMRSILDNSRSEWVTLQNELKALELYIELEAVRFDNAFSYHIEVANDVSKETALIPPLIIQPYVENAIWHGLLHRHLPGGMIAIKIEKLEKDLVISITDNGVGRKAAKDQKSKSSVLHKSHGMKITSERLSIVNNVYNVNAHVQVIDLQDEQFKPSGTKVLLTLNYQTNGYNNH